MSVDPIHKSVLVEAPVEDAWVVFTARLASWWPMATHSLGREEVETVVLEPREGGRMYERLHDGTEQDWGRVIAWEPPHRLSVAWSVNQSDGDQPTEWEVRFSADGDATRVDLEHRGWERMSVGADERRESYDNGWPGVLDAFTSAPVLTP